MGGGNVSNFISRKCQGVSVIKLLEATVTADEEPYEVYKPAARWQEAKEGRGDQKVALPFGWLERNGSFHSLNSSQSLACANESVAYLISSYLIRRSMIIADESHCGSSSVGIEAETCQLAGRMNDN